MVLNLMACVSPTQFNEGPPPRWPNKIVQKIFCEKSISQGKEIKATPFHSPRESTHFSLEEATKPTGPQL